MTANRTFGLIFAAAVLVAPAAHSASFGDLSGGAPGPQYIGPGPYAPGPYAAGPYRRSPGLRPGSLCADASYGACPGCGFMQPTSGGPEGALPPALDAPGGSDDSADAGLAEALPARLVERRSAARSTRA